MEDIYRFFDFNNQSFYTKNKGIFKKIQLSLLKIVEFNYTNNFLANALVGK